MSEVIVATAANLIRRCFDAKLGTMRKAQNFIVYPKRDDGMALIQSDKSIGMFDPATGKGKLFQGKGEHPSIAHLALYGKPCDFPAEVVEKVKAILG